MDEMARRYSDRGVESVFLYVREAHPGEKHLHHESLDQKTAHAREMVDTLGMERAMLVDDLDGSAHGAYGLLPNMTFVIRRRGTVVFRSSWTEPRSIELAVDGLFHEEAIVEERARGVSYFVEWEPVMRQDSAAFLQGLRRYGGERAADEFVEAVAGQSGEGAARRLRLLVDELRRSG